ncbi:hypothetical protein BEL04_15950 [Mucilaginibacter sp. PPCGB 2223]|uniref:M12 family metallopeptidase n=1 Tax=Mucilaginibacter sp. PPCGB 2223 TaxID=1886027 RepID=UPI000824631C|nr:M12 family metallopeptidase [Mucilaginibacter sp. PPCGB 2223]OCX51517.1 hypothetical protein BEL04_15950 [Mucilaginibacter sp. PPCGB 2223]
MKNKILFIAFVLLTIAGCKEQNNVGLTGPQATSLVKTEEAFPGQRGPELTGYYNGAPVKYMRINGKNVFQGDIILNNLDDPNSLHTSSTGRASYFYKWFQGIVYYTIDPGLPNQTRVTDAINHWQTFTNIRFVARTTEADYVTFVDDPNGCSSNVGLQGGQQFINININCTTGNVIHEIGHTIGLWHEQSRMDRDDYITINLGNVTSGYEFNFDTYQAQGGDGFDLYGSNGLDFGSIMMYGPYDFSSNGLPTITKKDGSLYTVQRTALSNDDIAGVNYMYSKSNLARITCGINGGIMGIGKAQSTLRGNGIFSYNTANGIWTQIYGTAVYIALDQNKIPLVIDNAGNIFQLTTSGIVSSQFPGTATSIAAGSFICITGTVPDASGNYAIYQYNGSSWTSIGRSGVRVAVSGAGQIWVVNAAGSVVKKSGSTWTAVSGVTAKDIAIGGDGTVFMLGTTPDANGNYTLYRNTAALGTQLIPSGSCVSVAVTPQGEPYIVTSNGNSYHGVKAGNPSGTSYSWTQVNTIQ